MLRCTNKELLQIISKKTYLPMDTVKLVYEALMHTIKEEVVKGKEVILSNFGKVHPVLCRNPLDGSRVPTVKVRLSKSTRDIVKGDKTNMEKYGVVVDPNKPPAVHKTCPSCGSKLLPGTNVPYCPRCGTHPFEQESHDYE